MRNIFLFTFICLLTTIHAQVIDVSVDPTKDVKPISPYIYGRNNNFPKESYAASLTTAQWTQLKESGVQFLREGGGNNSTKYNWRNGLSSHPDWYNNVYSESWDNPVKLLRDNMAPSVTGMWTLSLIGKTAANNTNNFNDWGYNSSQWWSGTGQNLAGGGVVNPAGGNQATVNGNPSRYLQDWNADSVVGILDHWRNNLGIPDSRIRYWNMDNEPEIWHGTHDDIVNANLSPETFMQNYFAVAKKARAKFPSIKLVGPVPANEWQWFNWMNRNTTINGRFYPWLEFFIKRCAEEQAASGIRLLDVLDIHFYPSESTPEQIGQLHRIFFDRNYNYPGANGLKSINGGWDNSLTKEYIFGRINDWLTQYFGQNHGIKLGLTETDVNSNNPSVVATWYASTMGEFMKNDVALFTPWSWKVGMWETLHLFARYNQTLSVQGISSDETSVSAYPSVNDAKNTMTVVLVNRSTTSTQSVNLNVSNFVVQTPSVQALRLSNLSSTETFVSHTNNALQQIAVNFSNNTANLSLPPLSITSITVSGRILTSTFEKDATEPTIVPNPTQGLLTIKNVEKLNRFDLFDVNGRFVRSFQISGNELSLDISDLHKGCYFAVIDLGGIVYHKKIIKL
ncbi:MAG: T9SS type A sorting domain-containing protein [Saprospiraceae bacterium]|nr:T9SS type A sorting domain-containing protein [Saprospiraceae bacterium]